MTPAFPAYRPETPRARHRSATAAWRRRIEEAWERGFEGPGLIDLHAKVRGLPLLVQCATRVHERREGHVLLFTFEDAEARVVLVAAGQRVVLLFSTRGALDAAGELVPLPGALAGRWTRIDWAADVTTRDWY